jgi:ABC-type multidrug transport system ATPase subunit
VPHIDKPMYMLSTGSKRKVWLAAALATLRPLTLLDEPTGGLDAASIRCLWRTLDKIARTSDRAVVIASGERISDVALTATIELPLHPHDGSAYRGTISDVQ